MDIPKKLKNYFENLMNENKSVIETNTFTPLDTTDTDIKVSYMRTTGVYYESRRFGLMNEYIKNNKNIKIQSTKRKTLKDYIEIYEKDNKILFIYLYSGGKLDVIYKAYYKDNKRFLVPYSKSGSFYPTYTYVTVYEKEKIVEEYMVDDSQIVYEKYEYKKESVNYYFYEYVPNGSYPLRTLDEGVFTFENGTTSFNYTSKYCYLTELYNKQ